MRKYMLLAFGLTAVLAGGAGVAHARLESSSPPDHAQLSTAPKTLTLNFNESAQVARLSLTSDGKEIPIVLDKTAKAARSVTVSLPTLSPGKYTVQWTALAADDGHITKGSFAFAIAGP